ncbi:hypothetical protein BDW74DRAFT_141928 [Aspergillus multicolor]|uniref:uncharacterized protein n=1 Tax=Aspergillus multicolor TaxID=41759 RepID=UPI003CCD8590
MPGQAIYLGPTHGNPTPRPLGIGQVPYKHNQGEESPSQLAGSKPFPQWTALGHTRPQTRQALHPMLLMAPNHTVVAKLEVTDRCAQGVYNQRISDKPKPLPDCYNVKKPGQANRGTDGPRADTDERTPQVVSPATGIISSSLRHPSSENSLSCTYVLCKAARNTQVD